MSKSKNNYPDPMLVIKDYGVDSLRLYLMSSTVMKSENLNFSSKEVADLRKKVFVIWWNIFAFYKQCNVLEKLDIARAPKPNHIMDVWLMSRLNSLVTEVTQYMDQYNVVKASRALIEFVNELSTWYLRRSRDRLRQANPDSEELHCFGYALLVLAQLFAPITPFFPENLYHNLVDESASIHHTDWPNAQENFIDTKLEEEMQLVKEITELVHAKRAEHGIKVRQPLAKVSYKSPKPRLRQELIEVLLEEVNVQTLEWQTGNPVEVILDTNITPELKEEGEARELIRSIQQQRKKAGLNPKDRITVSAPNWPESWTPRIQETTNAVELKKGDVLQVVKLEENSK